MSARSLHKKSAPLGRSTVTAVTLLAAVAGIVASSAESNATVPGARRVYGAAQSLGNGQVRTYVVRKDGIGAPIEVGVAFTEAAMDNLPAAPAATKSHTGNDHAATDMPAHSAHTTMTERLLELPANHGTQFKFVELNWNPAGHEPPGVSSRA